MKKISFGIKYFILVLIIIIGFSSNFHMASAHMTYTTFNISYSVVPSSSSSPSGTLTLSPNYCTIPIGASSCSITGASWTTTNATNPQLVDDQGNVLSTNANQSSLSPLTVSVAYPSTTFYLKDGSTLLGTPQTATSSAPATCAPGSTWDSTANGGAGACVAAVSLQPFINSLTLSYTSLRANMINPTIAWSVSNNPTSCTTSSDWTNPPTASNPNNLASGSASQGILTQTRTYTYTLTCINAFGSDTKTVTVTPIANPILKVKEI
ncbi:MAG: hypothetical protein KGI58_00025 [Patescibacteria group bacterium]|nr:hypothetical protein [Patescibacteria group bacterium]